MKSFEITDIPVRWYTFKRRTSRKPSASTLDLPEEHGGQPSTSEPNSTEDAVATESVGGVDIGDAEEDDEQELTEEVMPPPPALKALYSPWAQDKFLLAMGGWAKGAIFECSWEVMLMLRVNERKSYDFSVPRSAPLTRNSKVKNDDTLLENRAPYALTSGNIVIPQT